MTPSKLSFSQKIRFATAAAFHRNTPLKAKGLLLGGLLYGILPLDLVPDILPLIGITDDATVILGVIFGFLYLTKKIRAELERSERQS